MQPDINPWRQLIFALGLFLVFHLAASLSIHLNVIAFAPTSLQAFIRLSAFLSALTIAGGALAIIVFALIFAWSLLTLAGSDIQLQNFLNAAIWFIATVCTYEALRLIFAWTLLPPELQNVKGVNVERYAAFIERGIWLTRWGYWQGRIDLALLFLSPVIFGTGLRREAAAKWWDVVIGILSIASALMLARILGQVVDLWSFLKGRP